MTPKEKAVEIFNKFQHLAHSDFHLQTGWDEAQRWENQKQCALICVENEYYSLREQLINLRSCGLIQNDKVYLHRLQELIDEEQQVKTEIEKL